MNNFPYDNPIDTIFVLFQVLFFLGFFLVLGIIIFRLFQSAKQWNRNNESPVLSVDAVLVTKRTSVSYYSDTNTTDTIHTHSSFTSFFATFEVESGDRMEFSLQEREYGLLAEKDTGKLTFQGTRYLGFNRNK